MIRLSRSIVGEAEATAVRRILVDDGYLGMGQEVQRFEQEQKCKVVIDTYDSNESMYAKLKAGASGYDLVTPSSYQVSVMAQQGMLQDLDHAVD